MADYTDPATANHRLSNAEREQAVSALAQALADGRITTDEFTERSTTARAAVTNGDLAPLFADLPAAAHSIPTPPPAAATYPPAGGAYGGTSPYDGGYGGYTGRGAIGGRQPLGGSAGVVFVSLMPFIALALFFIFGYGVNGWNWSWIFFLLIPLAGIVVYGAGTRRDN